LMAFTVPWCMGGLHDCVGGGGPKDATYQAALATVYRDRTSLGRAVCLEFTVTVEDHGPGKPLRAVYQQKLYLAVLCGWKMLSLTVR
jgi:hypothetical protein